MESSQVKLVWAMQHIFAIFPLIPPAPFSHKGRRGSQALLSEQSPSPLMGEGFRVRVLLFALVFLLSACNLTNDPVELTPEPTADLPRAEILEPANNQQVIEGTEFSFDVVGRDGNPGISHIELRIDEIPLDDVPPADDEFVPVLRVSIPWRATGVGLHVIEVIAYRPDGTPSDPAIINIEVVPRE